jgi:hypothetical protein
MWAKGKAIPRSIEARTARARLDANGVALRVVTRAGAEGWSRIAALETDAS